MQSKTKARIYPAYHTAYDTFDYSSKYIDPGTALLVCVVLSFSQHTPMVLLPLSLILLFIHSGFTSHQTVGRTAGNVLLRLADSLLLPFNCSDYAESLEGYLKVAIANFRDELTTHSISMGRLPKTWPDNMSVHQSVLSVLLLVLSLVLSCLS